MENQADIPTWIMALIALGFFGALAGVAFFIHERRRIGFEKLARRRGLMFHELAPKSVRLPEDFIREVETGIVVNSTHRRVLELDADKGRVKICELLRYRARSEGGQRGYYSLSVAMIEFPDRELPRFSLDPEKLRHKLVDLKKGEDIDFEDSAGFSGKYLLRGDSEPAIRDFFTPGRRAFFERHPRLHLRSYGSVVVFYRIPRLLRWSAFRPGPAERLLDEALEIRQALSD